MFSFEKNAFKYAFCRKKKYKPLQQKKICSKWYQSLFSHYLHQPDMNVFLWRPAVSLRRNLWFAAAKNLLVQASHILWCIYYRLAMSFQHIYYDALFKKKLALRAVWPVMKCSVYKVFDSVCSFCQQRTFFCDVPPLITINMFFDILKQLTERTYVYHLWHLSYSELKKTKGLLQQFYQFKSVGNYRQYQH